MSALFASSNLFGAIYINVIEVGGSSFPDTDWVVSFVDGDGIIIHDNNPGFLSVETGTIAYEYNWALASEGQAIDSDFFSTATLFADNSDATFADDFMPVSNGDKFFWGFWYDLDGSYDSIVGSGDYLGWAEFRFFGGELEIIQSYADDTGVGMLVGDTSPIPEGSQSALVLSVAVLTLLRRRIFRI